MNKESYNKKQRAPKVKGAKKIINTELVPFSRQLASMLRSGMSLVVSLSTIEEQLDNLNFKEVVKSVRETVESGDTFSDGLTRFPAIFDELYINIVRAGERSGKFAEAMARLSKLLDDAAKLRRKVRSALAYPVVVLVMALAIATALIIFVMPIFADMFQDFGHDLPGPTQFLMNLSSFLRGYWWLVLIIGGTIRFVVKSWISTAKGTYLLDHSKLRMPVFGKLNQMVAMSRFASIFSQMLHSGVPILTALWIVSKAVGNSVVGSSILEARAVVERGENLSKGLENRVGIPLLVVRMMAAGERSGKVDEMLDSIAVTYEEEVDTLLATLTSLLEPLLMAFLGVIIGGIVISMYLPIFKMSTIIGN